MVANCRLRNLCKLQFVIYAGNGAEKFQAYTSLLAFAAVISKLHPSNVASAHAAFVLLVVWGVFVYRDVWPLATFTLSPLDAAEGALLWVKLAILTLAAVVIPLIVPRRYVPVDPLVCHLASASQLL